MGEDRGHLLSYHTTVWLFLLDMETENALHWLRLMMMTRLHIQVTVLEELVILAVPAAASC
jgi:hypothetical protein